MVAQRKEISSAKADGGGFRDMAFSLGFENQAAFGWLELGTERNYARMRKQQRRQSQGKEISRRKNR